jgi:hypothetical protein
MNKITLGKSEKENTYNAESDIYIDIDTPAGRCIGTVEIKYGYTLQNKLRIKEYCVSVHKTWIWQYLMGETTYACSTDTVVQSFKVDGTWETKSEIYPWSTKVLTGFETFTSEYKTTKAAKAAALAFITDVVKYGIFQ